MACCVPRGFRTHPQSLGMDKILCQIPTTMSCLGVCCHCIPGGRCVAGISRLSQFETPPAHPPISTPRNRQSLVCPSCHPHLVRTTLVASHNACQRSHCSVVLHPRVHRV